MGRGIDLDTAKGRYAQCSRNHPLLTLARTRVRRIGACVSRLAIPQNPAGIARRRLPNTVIAEARPRPRARRTRTSSRCSASAASRRSSGPSSSAPRNDNLFKFAFTVMVTYQLQVELAAAGDGGARDRRAVHPAVPAVLGHQRPARRQVRQDAHDPLRQERSRSPSCWSPHSASDGTTCALLLALRVPDGPALDAVRPREVRLPAAAPERARADRRQRHGGDGHVRRHPAGQRGRRPAGRDAGGRARTRGDRLRRARAARAASSRSSCRRRRRPIPALEDQLEPGHRNAAQPEARAREPRRCSARCWASAGCGSSARCSCRSSRRFAKEVLHGDEQVASLLLVVFSIGIGIGSLLCEVLSRRHVEIGLVPLGAIGMTRVRGRPVLRVARPAARRPALALCAVRRQPAHWRVMADLALLSPVRGPVQRADVCADPAARAADAPGAHHRRQQHPQCAVHDRQRGHRRRAARSSASRIPQMFLLVGLANAVVAVYIFLLVPEYLLRFVAWVRVAAGLPLQGARRRATSRSRARRSWCATT